MNLYILVWPLVRWFQFNKTQAELGFLLDRVFTFFLGAHLSGKEVHSQLWHWL